MQKFIDNLFVKKTQSTYFQFIRYGFVAVIALIADAGTLFLCKEKLHFSSILSATIGFSFGLVVNYLLSVLWVFSKANVKKRWHELAIFSVIGLVGLAMTDLIIAVLTKHTGLVISKAIAIFIVYFWNFFARKKILYNTPLMEETL